MKTIVTYSENTKNVSPSLQPHSHFLKHIHCYSPLDHQTPSDFPSFTHHLTVMPIYTPALNSLLLPVSHLFPLSFISPPDTWLHHSHSLFATLWKWPRASYLSVPHSCIWSVPVICSGFTWIFDLLPVYHLPALHMWISLPVWICLPLFWSPSASIMWSLVYPGTINKI